MVTLFIVLLGVKVSKRGNIWTVTYAFLFNNAFSWQDIHATDLVIGFNLHLLIAFKRFNLLGG